jgi:hypothetical protein
MDRHIVARFATHEEAERAAFEITKSFAGKVSISSREPKENWWHPDRWLEVSLEAVGGLAATVSNLVPGFGVLFMGGPLEGVRQGEVLADWLQAHPEEKDREDTAFVIIAVGDADDEQASMLLAKYGGTHIHRVRGGAGL